MRYMIFIFSMFFIVSCGSDGGLTDPKVCNRISIENQSNYELTIEMKLSNFLNTQTTKLKTSESTSIEVCDIGSYPPPLASSLISLNISTILNDQPVTVYSGLKTTDWIKTTESKLLDSYKLILTDLKLTISQ
jgi:hypothetical protein